jgi:hypothetical protein
VHKQLKATGLKMLIPGHERPGDRCRPQRYQGIENEKLTEDPPK